MSDPHLLLLTLHDPTEFAFPAWLPGLAPGALSLVLDQDSVPDGALAVLRADPAYGFVRAYPNYLNNGNVYADLDALHRTRPVTHILAFGEDDVIRAARLRQRWGLPGQSVANATRFRDKVQARARVQAAGLPAHAGAALHNPLDLLDFVAAHGLPVFVKPRTSSGSVFGRKLADSAALTAFLDTGFAPRVPYAEYVSDLCVETFHPGRLYHVDGLAAGSEVVWSWPSQYLTPGLEIGAFAHTQVVGSVMLDRLDPLFGPLQAYARAACAALELPSGHTFHAEIFVHEDGSLSLCEIACRTGGGRINETLHRAGGPHLNEWQCRLQAGLVDEAAAQAQLRGLEPAQLCGWMLFPPQEGVCLQVPDFTGLPGVESAQLNIAPGEVGWARGFSGDAAGHVVVAGPDGPALAQAMRAALQRLQMGLVFGATEGVPVS
ncbi:hypothetical protein [Deinococcus arcticus]|uniref:ATP-grasp domain-containing protein n=1 Tax=Deinococcus arcticus TaxID=2136176 RepID=A0A2T3WAQ6_9DEIO|nr:hypothetical protein [Deinococcus arcticus]PTA68927.1 hypothetical protein C8263_03740 [Deinococcus arcticus]